MNSDESISQIAAIIGNARRELLELSARNPLVNFRPHSAKGLALSHPNVQEILKWLTQDEAAVRFLPQESKSSQPRRIPTDEPKENLYSRLLKTYAEARTLLEEQGINSLHLALGAVVWRESEASQQTRKAPLVLIPVALERREAGTEFTMSFTGEETGANASFVEKVRNDFGMTMPPLPGDEEGDFSSTNVHEYFDAVEKTVAQRGWTVDREFVALSLFNFSKLQMYRDLDLKDDADLIAESDIFQSLFGERKQVEVSATSISDDYKIDEYVSPLTDYHVLDADATQIRAIKDVKAGKHLVIQGPPGTGKSQTIANIIAEAAADGKTVLFVAEKMAALEVVKRRMTAIGLGELCLELHSRKTNKKSVLDDIKRTFELSPPTPTNHEAFFADLLSSRDELNAYVEALHTTIGNTDLTPFEAYGVLALNAPRSTEDGSPTPERPEFFREDLAEWSRERWQDAREIVNRLESALRAFNGASPSAHPARYSGLTTTPTVVDMTKLPTVVEDFLDKATALSGFMDKAKADHNLDLRNVADARTLEKLLAAQARVNKAGIFEKLLGNLFSTEYKQSTATLKSAPHGFIPALDPEASLLTLQRMINGYVNAAATLTTSIELDAGQLQGGQPLAEIALEDAKLFAREFLQEGLPQLREFTAFRRAEQDALQNGLSEMMETAWTWDADPAEITLGMEMSRLNMAVSRAQRERPALAQHDSDAHERLIDKFRSLDEASFDHQRARVADAHWEQLPARQAPGQVEILQREFNKRRRHIPIRRLLAEAGDAVQAIKPIFMMSPLSVATYIKKDGIKFDVVIFDEASQVQPVDAFGALLRGRQAVVVGDDKQLPPTDFFSAAMSEEPDEVEDPVAVSDMESILALFKSRGAAERMLRWHYRSRHESLIAVSNREFYDHNLVFYASPDGAAPDLGLHYVHHDEPYEGSGQNRGEARIVANAVMQHALEHPELSLGVAAFSARQRDAIANELEKLRRQRPATEQFFNDNEAEPFFVKNLENVQGDERDVIFISVGYGRNAAGMVHQTFGPLNNEGGERRLNVLITRAKRACRVFTNLHADDVSADAQAGRKGRAAFRTFLSYAETGVLPVDTAYETGRAPLSPFQQDVANRLRAKGCIVHDEVATSGFFVDIGIADPERPGRYVLGIECDGATYHGSQSARDRDRLRQQVLEGLGWRIHRIWSTDYFADPEREINKAVDAVKDALASTEDKAQPETQDQSDAAAAQPAAAEPRTTHVIQREQRDDMRERTKTGNVAPYVMADTDEIARQIPPHGLGLEQIPIPALAQVVKYVVDQESPVHREEVKRRIATAAGSRMGSRIRENLDKAVAHAENSRWCRCNGGFMYATDGEIAVRDRSNLSGRDKDIDLIADGEIALAVVRTVESSYEMRTDDLPVHAGRMLGFSTTTAKVRNRVEPVVRKLVQNGDLNERNGKVTARPQPK